ncbi:hypothetical protein CH369_18010 [Leptospira levettii]|uniref:terminase large subunit domain-containing protein n=1 Tax=Leptospira levettii TaxID=2023178 RepID=UPI000C2AAECB|nr:terminase family protein [Leptospira levettii]PJZ98860.1 hypothetical protein CH369_18010 [Leptospira levettii]
MTKPVDKVNGNTKKVLKQTRTKDGRFDKALVTKAQIVKELWKRGNLKYKILPHQLSLYESLHDENLLHVINCSRRFGKTFTLCCYIIEQCIKNPNYSVTIVAPTEKQLGEFIEPTMKKIFKDCPLELKPKMRASNHVYVFPNDSVIRIHGADKGNFKTIRGNESDIYIIDEAGFVDNLEELFLSVLLPIIQDTTGKAKKGKIFISSTRSPNPNHYFETLIDEFEVKGKLQKYTIHQAHYSEKEIIEMAVPYGGFDSPAWRREYLCERVADVKRQIIPEFDETKHVRTRTKDNFDSYHHRYVFADLGFRDLTVFLFATYVFSEATLYIENEWVSENEDNTLTTEIIAKNVRQKELETFGSVIPLIRIGDNDNLLLFNDLTTKYGYSIFSVHKQPKESMINQTKIMFSQNRIAVDPKCKNLITTLKSGLWNNTRTDFERNKIIGHCDSISALIYGIISIDYNRNPIPFTQLINPETQIVNPLTTTNYINNDSKRFEALQKAFTSHLDD